MRPSQPLQLLLISGMAGAGKSVALRAAEDVGYSAIDNLPVELFADLLELELKRGTRRLAIAMDARHAPTLPQLHTHIQALRARRDVQLRVIFCDADNAVLLRRFSETRRSHPLVAKIHSSPDPHASALAEAADASVNAATRETILTEAIAQEREALAAIRDLAYVLDTSSWRSAQLQTNVKAFLEAPQGQLTLVFASFGFKCGLPNDADFVFDVRMLPNPYYDVLLRDLTGHDAPVIRFLDSQAEVHAMANHIEQFLRHWLVPIQRDHRSYLTVAIGCTGGQHRSVYLAERLRAAFVGTIAMHSHLVVLTRHRELGT